MHTCKFDRLPENCNLQLHGSQAGSLPGLGRRLCTQWLKRQRCTIQALIASHPHPILGCSTVCGHGGRMQDVGALYREIQYAASVAALPELRPLDEAHDMAASLINREEYRRQRISVLEDATRAAAELLFHNFALVVAGVVKTEVACCTRLPRGVSRLGLHICAIEAVGRWHITCLEDADATVLAKRHAALNSVKSQRSPHQLRGPHALRLRRGRSQLQRTEVDDSLLDELLARSNSAPLPPAKAPTARLRVGALAEVSADVPDSCWDSGTVDSIAQNYLDALQSLRRRSSREEVITGTLVVARHFQVALDQLVPTASQLLGELLIEFNKAIYADESQAASLVADGTQQSWRAVAEAVHQELTHLEDTHLRTIAEVTNKVKVYEANFSDKLQQAAAERETLHRQIAAHGPEIQRIKEEAARQALTLREDHSRELELCAVNLSREEKHVQSLEEELKRAHAHNVTLEARMGEFDLQLRDAHFASQQAVNKAADLLDAERLRHAMTEAELIDAKARQESAFTARIAELEHELGRRRVEAEAAQADYALLAKHSQDQELLLRQRADFLKVDVETTKRELERSIELERTALSDVIRQEDQIKALQRQLEAAKESASEFETALSGTQRRCRELQLQCETLQLELDSKSHLLEQRSSQCTALLAGVGQLTILEQKVAHFQGQLESERASWSAERSHLLSQTEEVSRSLVQEQSQRSAAETAVAVAKGTISELEAKVKAQETEKAALGNAISESAGMNKQFQSAFEGPKQEKTTRATLAADFPPPTSLAAAADTLQHWARAIMRQHPLGASDTTFEKLQASKSGSCIDSYLRLLVVIAPHCFGPYEADRCWREPASEKWQLFSRVCKAYAVPPLPSALDKVGADATQEVPEALHLLILLQLFRRFCDPLLNWSHLTNSSVLSVAAAYSTWRLVAEDTTYKLLAELYAGLQDKRCPKCHRELATAQDYLEAAIAHRAAGELTNAVRHLEAGIKLYPAAAELHCLLGDVMHYDMSGEIAAAVEHYDNALEHAPGLLPALRGKADVLNNHLGRYAEALEIYSLVLERSSPTAALLSNRGICHKKQQLLEEALADFDNALKVDPNCSAAAKERTDLVPLVTAEQQHKAEKALRELQAKAPPVKYFRNQPQPDDTKFLDQFLRMLTRFCYVQVRVTGVALNAATLPLAVKRAQWCIEFLTTGGIGPERLHSRSRQGQKAGVEFEVF
eukprot:TRINITY_DN8751_c0_g1_i1.p1 TRINITY_DN8751_c0_g1~~TRINITY_DN8751_c0_g1_i1.p1  ORF type:complete len:1214 (+),score=226.28 TRINITY_DN8751_c0_g1_i1:824-4465(+)